MKDKLEEAAKHHTAAVELHQQVADRHAETTIGLSRLTDLAARAKAAHQAGRHNETGKLLDQLGAEAAATSDSNGGACDAHRALGRSLRAAQTAMREAIDSADKGGYVDPTAATGAQTSAGQSPRYLNAEDIRRRDQQRAVEAAYERGNRLRGAY